MRVAPNTFPSVRPGSAPVHDRPWPGMTVSVAARTVAARGLRGPPRYRYADPGVCAVARSWSGRVPCGGFAVRAVPERDDAALAAGARPGRGRAPCGHSRWSPRSGPWRAAMARNGPARKPNGSRLVSSASLGLSNYDRDLWTAQDLNL